MLTVEQALLRVLAQAAPIDAVELISVLDAAGRVLAQPVVAAIDVPPMDNAQMDGYAVRAADITQLPQRLRVSQRIAAGHVGTALAAGTAAVWLTSSAASLRGRCRRTRRRPARRRRRFLCCSPSFPRPLRRWPPLRRPVPASDARQPLITRLHPMPPQQRQWRFIYVISRLF